MTGRGRGNDERPTERAKSPSPEARLLPPTYPAPPEHVTTSAEVLTLADRLGQFARIAVDLESDSLYHYFDKVCLLQISAGGIDYIVDPLRGADLSPLRWIFADPAIEKIFHAADNDLALLSRSFGFETLGVYDTMVASHIAGHRQIGLSNLLAHYFSISLDKRYQRHDWSSRPLEPEHIQYARSDTHFLAALRDILHARVCVLGREAQLIEELSIVERKRPSPRQFSPDDCLRLPGANTLDPMEQRVLRALFVARDQIAREEDVPVFRVLPNDILLRMVQELPQTRGAIFQVRGMNPRTARAYADRLLEAIHRGVSQKSPAPKGPRRTPRPTVEPEIEERLQRLKSWRQKRAEILDLDLAMVASNAILSTVAEQNPETLEALRALPEVRNWQVDQFGTEWLTILQARGPSAGSGGEG